MSNFTLLQYIPNVFREINSLLEWMGFFFFLLLIFNIYDVYAILPY